MKLLDYSRTHVTVADRVIVSWSSYAGSSAHPLIDDARIRATRDDGVLDYTGWAIRLSARPVRPGGRARLLSIGTRPRVLPERRLSRLTRRGRQMRRNLRAPLNRATAGKSHDTYATGGVVPPGAPLLGEHR